MNTHDLIHYFCAALMLGMLVREFWPQATKGGGDG